MDDDTDNVQIAREFGHQAFEVPEDVSVEDIWRYAEKLEVRRVLPILEDIPYPQVS